MDRDKVRRVDSLKLLQPTGYPVGFRDVEWPSSPGSEASPVLLRIMYPADEAEEPLVRSKSHDYIPQQFGQSYIEEMASGWSWMFKGLLDTELPMAENAPMLCSKHPYPVFLFSHGSGGGRQFYSSLCMEIASQGFVVVAVEHTDGSACMAYRPDGSVVPKRELTLESSGVKHKIREFTSKRGVQCEYRLSEILRTVDALSLQNEDSDSFLYRRLDMDRVIGAGHSFGSCSVLGAALARPGWCCALVLMDSAMHWASKDTKAFLEKHVFADEPNHTRGYYESFVNKNASWDVHPQEWTSHVLESMQHLPVFFIYSHLYIWLQDHRSFDFLAAMRNGRFGARSAFCGLRNTSHMSFTDLPQMLPSWIPQSLLSLGTVVGRNEDIKSTAGLLRRLILSFLQDVKVAPTNLARIQNGTDHQNSCEGEQIGPLDALAEELGQQLIHWTRGPDKLCSSSSIACTRSCKSRWWQFTVIAILALSLSLLLQSRKPASNFFDICATQKLVVRRVLDEFSGFLQSMGFVST